MTDTSDRLKQHWTAEAYEANARFVSDLGGKALALLDPKHGERILDLGCGDGALTERIVKAGATVVGIDTSEDLLTAAKTRGLDVRTMDGHALTFDREFDAVFSNAALHWMTQPEKVIEGVRRALKPGGRFVGEFGGHGNVAAIMTALRAVVDADVGERGSATPWFYPTAEEYRAMLEGAGFAVREIRLHPRPTPLPTGMEGWLNTFRKGFFEDKKGTVALQRVLDLLRPSLCDAKGQWTADYVRLRFAADLAG